MHYFLNLSTSSLCLLDPVDNECRYSACSEASVEKYNFFARLRWLQAAIFKDFHVFTTDADFFVRLMSSKRFVLGVVCDKIYALAFGSILLW